MDTEIYDNTKPATEDSPVLSTEKRELLRQAYASDYLWDKAIEDGIKNPNA